MNILQTGQYGATQSCPIAPNVNLDGVPLETNEVSGRRSQEYLNGVRHEGYGYLQQQFDRRRDCVGHGVLVSTLRPSPAGTKDPRSP